MTLSETATLEQFPCRGHDNICSKSFSFFLVLHHVLLHSFPIQHFVVRVTDTLILLMNNAEHC